MKGDRHRSVSGARDWNVGLAKDLRDKTFARELLLAAIDEGVSIQVALGKVIRALGVKEFAASCRHGPSKRPAGHQPASQSHAGDAQSPPAPIPLASEPGAHRAQAPNAGVTTVLGVG